MTIWPKKIEAWHIVAVAIVSAVLWGRNFIAYEWVLHAEPAINCQIEQRLAPVEKRIHDDYEENREALQFNNFLHKNSMSKGQWLAAEEDLRQWKLSQGLKRN